MGWARARRVLPGQPQAEPLPAVSRARPRAAELRVRSADATDRQPPVGSAVLVSAVPYPRCRGDEATAV